jgi:hypothetical protein
MDNLKQNALSAFPCVIGIALLILNFYGVHVNPYAEYKRINNLENPDSIYDQLDSDYMHFGQTEKFVQAIANKSNVFMKYDWPTNYEYMPASENWILFTLRILDPVMSRYILTDPDTLIFENVELPDYKKAFNRGFGICSQQALAYSDLLWERYKVDARVAGLNGHVVVQILNLDRFNYILDPSFGAYTAGLVTEPQSISNEYLNKLQLVKKNYQSRIDNSFAAEPGGRPYSKKSHTKQLILFKFTEYSYWLKWAIPVVLIFYSVFRLKRYKN